MPRLAGLRPTRSGLSASRQSRASTVRRRRRLPSGRSAGLRAFDAPPAGGGETGRGVQGGSGRLAEERQGSGCVCPGHTPSSARRSCLARAPLPRRATSPPLPLPRRFASSAPLAGSLARPVGAQRRSHPRAAPPQPADSHPPYPARPQSPRPRRASRAPSRPLPPRSTPRPRCPTLPSTPRRRRRTRAAPSPTSWSARSASSRPPAPSRP